MSTTSDVHDSRTVASVDLATIGSAIVVATILAYFVAEFLEGYRGSLRG